MEGNSNIKSLDKGSFRDRTAQIFYHDGGVYRGLTESAATVFNQVSGSKAYTKLIDTNQLIPTSIDNQLLDSIDMHGWSMVLKHQKIPFVSYPYEWCFLMLKDAALLQLEIMQELLRDGYILKDGSAYNVQWQGTNPVFIDITSIVKFKGEGLWSGYRQFCQHFLYPLMLTAHKAINSAALLRSNLDGIDSTLCRKLLGTGKIYKKGVFFHVLLQDLSKRNTNLQNNKISKLPLQNDDLANMILKNIQGLINVINSLNIADASHWADYGETHSYNQSDLSIKDDFIEYVSEHTEWGVVWDIGCNNGRFSKIMAKKAEYVIAVDSDHATVNRLYYELKQSKVTNILPLCMNLANPSPSQGWNNCERDAFTERGKPQLIIALALIHHIVIAEQIPLAYFIDWLKNNCSFLVIEFVDVSDPMVKILLQATDEPVPDYSKDNFENELRKHFSIIKEKQFDDRQRTLYFCEKK